MTRQDVTRAPRYDHVYLGAGHERNERRAWFVIALCGAMMLIEIAGGLAYGSIALVADGLHMSTHAGALLLAALAYTFSRRYARDPRFSFGTGKLGDLAGFTSAVVLAMIALLIGWEAAARLLAPVPIRFGEAIPIAVLGLCVNIASAWLLGGGDHHHGQGHGHHHGHDHHGHGRPAHGGDHADDGSHRLETSVGLASLTIHEEGAPPRFRLAFDLSESDPGPATVTTVRGDGSRQAFALVPRDGYLESEAAIPEPHAFTALLHVAGGEHEAHFEEHDHAHGDHHRDNNMRAAVVHVLADAAVSALVIVGLVLARLFGWLWMDPLAGIVGALVIASWSWGLVRDTGAILLDMTPDRELEQRLRRGVEAEGDHVVDLHLWRLGPGHLGAIVAVETRKGRTADFYRERLGRLPSISHLTVEVTRAT
ncbi:CDF family Co(II)/Ni(II) efflux transporter DmeF [uncultured Sphingomonas sp.]|uniref:CDF family Co(II)/Ni(II) efflux transporter DmeF n=1 Tax=uncultured Sphingomonas sp. TaxID=158754 RepID=UPI0035CB0130